MILLCTLIVKREKVQQKISYLYSLYILIGSLSGEDSGSVVTFHDNENLDFNVI